MYPLPTESEHHLAKKDASEQWTSVTCYQQTCICNKQPWQIPNGKEHSWKLRVPLMWNTIPSIIFTRKCSIQSENLYSYLPYILCLLKQTFSGYSPYFLLNFHKAIWAKQTFSGNSPYFLLNFHKAIWARQTFSGNSPYFLLNLHKAIWAILWNLMLWVYTYLISFEVTTNSFWWDRIPAEQGSRTILNLDKCEITWCLGWNWKRQSVYAGNI